MDDTPKITDTPHHLTLLDALAARYSKAREKLAGLQSSADAEIAAIRRSYRVRIKDALQAVIGLRDQLKAAIQARPATFERPRSRTLHGIKLGFHKQRGQVSWPKGQADKVVARIERLFPDQAEQLIDTKKVPSKTGLQKLSAADLKRLGVSITADSDAVVIKDVASDLDKLIDALLEGDDSQEDDES